MTAEKNRINVLDLGELFSCEKTGVTSICGKKVSILSLFHLMLLIRGFMQVRHAVGNLNI